MIIIILADGPIIFKQLLFIFLYNKVRLALNMEDGSCLH